MPYTLVRDAVSRDTLEAFTQLAEGAATGDVLGGAFVVFLKGRRYIVNVCGNAVRNATLTRGALRVLDDHLAEFIEGRDPDETR